MIYMGKWRAEIQSSACALLKTAKVCLNRKHGVEIQENELRLFIRWNDDDSASYWEVGRDQSIEMVQRNGNPRVT